MVGDFRKVSKYVGLSFAQAYAKTHPFFREYVIKSIAKTYNLGEVGAKMWMLKIGKPVNIPVLSEAQAIELGGNILGEAIVFTIASLVLIAELQRQAMNEEIKLQRIRQEWDDVLNSLDDLKQTLEDRQQRINRIKKLVEDGSLKIF